MNDSFCVRFLDVKDFSGFCDANVLCTDSNGDSTDSITDYYGSQLLDTQ